MTLNWNPQAIIEIIVGIIVMVAGILTYFEPKTKKIKSLFFIRLGIIFMSLFFLVSSIAILYLNTIIYRIGVLMLLPTSVFFIIGINYIIKETFNSITLIIAFCLGILYCYLALNPNSVIIKMQFGFLNLDMRGLFEVIGDFITVLLGVEVFYWGLKTWLNTPFLIKKEAFIFFIGLLFISVITLIIYSFYYWDPIFILFSDISLGIGILIFIIAIMVEPKLLYILPFTIHRIIVKDKEGFPLYDHDWSESNISETIFSGFLNAVQLMSKEVMDIGGLLDINLEEGMLILRESELITVGLVASKSSKLLRDSVVKFTHDFEENFQRELKLSIKDMDQYEGAYELIEKYFSNFPYKIIKSRKHPLLLTGKYAKIPLELDNKLKKILTVEEEYEAIRTELLKSPMCVYSEFMDLYDELRDEIEKIEGEEPKYLGTDYKNRK